MVEMVWVGMGLISRVRFGICVCTILLCGCTTQDSANRGNEPSRPESVTGAKLLNSDQLRTLLIGNTEQGQYKHLSHNIHFSQFYAASGEIEGSSKGGSFVGKYSGRYEIRDSGCFYTKMNNEDDAADGCNYYAHLQGERYRVYGPHKAITDVRISPGNHRFFEGQP